MAINPLKSLADYSRFVAELLNRPTVLRTTVAVWSDSPHTGTTAGEVLFSNGFSLRMREELDFEAGLITSYGYEVYQRGERLYWYDDFPHPNDQALASTFPHHKHVPPNIKQNRVPAPEMSFTHPNLPALIRQLEKLIKA